MRKYKINEQFFDSWSEPMAYILGFIIADGNVSKQGSTLRMCIHKKDMALLHYMNEQFGASYPIRYQRGYPCVCWNSNKMIASLARLGVLPNKRETWDGFNYDIPDEFISSVIRGFFDGDGWICLKEGKYRKMHASGFANKSRKFLQQIKDIVPVTGGYLQTRTSWFQLTFADKDSLKLRDFMYKNSGFCLNRKKERFYAVGV